MKTRWIVAGVLTVLAMPIVASAEGVVSGTQQGASQGAKEGAKQGNKAAGPVGGVGGGAVGTAVGGVTGGVQGGLSALLQSIGMEVQALGSGRLARRMPRHLFCNASTTR